MTASDHQIGHGRSILDSCGAILGLIAAILGFPRTSCCLAAILAAIYHLFAFPKQLIFKILVAVVRTFGVVATLVSFCESLIKHLKCSKSERDFIRGVRAYEELMEFVEQDSVRLSMPISAVYTDDIYLHYLKLTALAVSFVAWVLVCSRAFEALCKTVLNHHEDEEEEWESVNSSTEQKSTTTSLALLLSCNFKILGQNKTFCYSLVVAVLATTVICLIQKSDDPAYHVLGLTSNFTDRDIQKAFVSLSRAFKRQHNELDCRADE